MKSPPSTKRNINISCRSKFIRGEIYCNDAQHTTSPLKTSAKRCCRLVLQQDSEFVRTSPTVPSPITSNHHNSLRLDHSLPQLVRLACRQCLTTSPFFIDCTGRSNEHRLVKQSSRVAPQLFLSDRRQSTYHESTPSHKVVSIPYENPRSSQDQTTSGNDGCEMITVDVSKKDIFGLFGTTMKVEMARDKINKYHMFLRKTSISTTIRRLKQTALRWMFAFKLLKTRGRLKSNYFVLLIEAIQKGTLAYGGSLDSLLLLQLK